MGAKTEIRGNKQGYKDLLVEKNYIKHFAANIVNRFGDSIDALAFSWMVYEITGSRAWSATVFGLNTLPTIFLMPFAGVIIQRYDKKKVMIIADIARAVLVIITTLLYTAGLVTPFVLGGFTFLMSCFESFRIPAGIALYPKIIPKEKYTYATSLSHSVGSLFQIIGTSAFGFIIVFLKIEGAMIINAATFLISAFFLSRIKLEKTTQKAEKINFGGFKKEFLEGFSYLYSKKLIFIICILGSLIGVLFIPINSMQTPYIKESLGLGAVALSVMGIALLTGNMLGTIIFPKINQVFKKSTLFLIGGGMIGFYYLACVFISLINSVSLVYISLAIASFFSGIFGSFISLVVNISFMENVEDDYLSRVGSIFNSLASMFTPLFSFIIAGISVKFSVNTIFMVSGIFTIIGFFLLSFNKTLKQL